METDAIDYSGQEHPWLFRAYDLLMLFGSMVAE